MARSRRPWRSHLRTTLPHVVDAQDDHLVLVAEVELVDDDEGEPPHDELVGPVERAGFSDARPQRDGAQRSGDGVHQARGGVHVERERRVLEGLEVGESVGGEPNPHRVSPRMRETSASLANSPRAACAIA